MARIAGVDLPLNKRVEIGLTYIYGIGRPRSNDILSKANVRPDTRVKDLSEDEVVRIRKIITDEGRVEGDLRKDVSMDIKRLMDIGCSRTRKGPRKQTIAGKKKATKK
jgi:small subunit ribosomal protein S13